MQCCSLISTHTTQPLPLSSAPPPFIPPLLLCLCLSLSVFKKDNNIFNEFMLAERVSAHQEAQLKLIVHQSCHAIYGYIFCILKYK